MANIQMQKKKLNIEIDTNGLTDAQVRLIRSLNAMLTHVLLTDEESEFFDGSAEFMRMCAALIKQSHFTEKLLAEENIPYADQALEFAVDVLSEHMTLSKVVQYDN
ncbi:MAG: hypothetical protein CME70_21165 [Halobacteriovorax sp.]|nr:hypothetical protein [Halobacteriovorax sp.]|tara:strand:+ start:87147 stop:87464 length:318 start_codon:yes stop_codon:yes gene_type:complete